MSWLLFLMSFYSLLIGQSSAITFQSGGRLGDKLVTYCKAKWFAKKHGLPFLCPDFRLQNKLMLGVQETHVTPELETFFNYKRIVEDESEIDALASNTLFVVDFFVTSDELPGITREYDQNVSEMKKVFNSDPSFLEELRFLIAPRKPVAELVLPEDQVTVAVHVRRGCGGDKPLLHKEAYSDKQWPAKFPPDHYYIDQIRRLYGMLGSKPMYVYIFTDYSYPEEVVEKIKNALHEPTISFGCRQVAQYENYVLDDLFAMTQFDCLIRSSSHYSGMAYLLGNHRYMIAAHHGSWHGDYLTIDEISISYRHDDGSISYEYVKT